MGVPHSLGNLAWGCQILGGAKSTVTSTPVAGMQPDAKRATGGLDWGGGWPYLTF